MNTNLRRRAETERCSWSVGDWQCRVQVPIGRYTVRSRFSGKPLCDEHGVGVGWTEGQRQREIEERRNALTASLAARAQAQKIDDYVSQMSARRAALQEEASEDDWRFAIERGLWTPDEARAHGVDPSDWEYRGYHKSLGETRAHLRGGFELRAVEMEFQSDRTGRNLDGFLPFNSRTRVPDKSGDFDEELKPGFADRSLKESGYPTMQFDHGRDPRTGTLPIGRWTSWQKERGGYRVRGHLLDSDLVEPIRVALADGALNGMSFRFKVSKNGDKWERRAGRDGVDLRHVMDCDVPEAGPVTHPAYRDAKIAVRSVLS